EHHRQFIIDIVDKNNTITFEELRVNILERFEDIQNISIATLCNFVKNIERITLKKSTPMELKRNDPTTLKQRKEFVMSLQPEGVLYNMNCIFIDEAGFNVNMIKGRARAKAGKPAFVKTCTKRAKNVSIFFALSAFGVESCHVK
ncbi:hypothetical protein BD770DRAFT_299451, partial [Pilaira anomala]